MKMRSHFYVQIGCIAKWLHLYVQTHDDAACLRQSLLGAAACCAWRHATHSALCWHARQRLQPTLPTPTATARPKQCRKTQAKVFCEGLLVGRGCGRCVAERNLLSLLRRVHQRLQQAASGDDFHQAALYDRNLQAQLATNGNGGADADCPAAAAAFQAAVQRLLIAAELFVIRDSTELQRCVAPHAEAPAQQGLVGCGHVGYEKLWPHARERHARDWLPPAVLRGTKGEALRLAPRGVEASGHGFESDTFQPGEAPAMAIARSSVSIEASQAGNTYAAVNQTWCYAYNN